MKRWPTKPLGEFVEEQAERLREAPTTIYSVTNERGFVRSLDLFDKQVFSVDTGNYKRVGFHDIAYNPSRINVGSVAMLEDKSGGAVSPMYVIVRCKPGLLPRYLLHFLKSDAGLHQIRQRCEGAVRFQLKFRDLCAIPILAPPLAEQERIVRLLDEADELRKFRDQANTRTAAFTPALFNEMFGDPENNPKNYPVDTLGKIISSTKLGLVRGVKETDDSLPFPYLRMDAILGDGNLALTPMKRVNATANEVAEFSLLKGDFLFNTRNSFELVGKTALFDGDGTYLFNNNIMRIRFNDVVDPHYMIALFQTDFVKRQLKSRKSGTTSVVAIYFKNLSSLKVVIPPMPLQKEFAKRVAEIREMEAAQAASRQRLEALFQSMLHRAFNGEL